MAMNQTYLKKQDILDSIWKALFSLHEKEDDIPLNDEVKRNLRRARNAVYKSMEALGEQYPKHSDDHTAHEMNKVSFGVLPKRLSIVKDLK